MKNAPKVTEARRETSEERFTRMAAEMAARRAKMPGVLFQMMCQAQAMSNMGADVMFDVYAAMPAEHASREEMGRPGVLFRFGMEKARQTGEDWRDHVVREAVTVESEEWRLTMVQKMLDEAQLMVDEKKRQRALAEEAKKLLSPEQLAALKQYG